MEKSLISSGQSISRDETQAETEGGELVHTIGLRKFNNRFHQFSVERSLRPKDEEFVDISYTLHTLETIDDRKISKSSLNAMIRSGVEVVSHCHPEEQWAVCEVSGKRNNFPHCIAAYLNVVKPNNTEWHFYYELNHLICDSLLKIIDRNECPLGNTMTQLEYFRWMSMGGNVTADAGPAGADLPDIRGGNPPVQKEDDTAAMYEQALADYEQQWKQDRDVIRAKYVAFVTRSGDLCSLNFNMMMVGVAELTGTVVELYIFKSDHECKLEQNYTPSRVDDGEVRVDDGEVIPLLYDPDEKLFMVAIPLRLVATFQTPIHEPKNSMTHDSKGVQLVKALNRNQLTVDAKLR